VSTKVILPHSLLARDEPSAKLFVIDGHQRLRTIQYFYSGVFRGKVFALRGVQQRYDGKTYKTLENDDQLRLNDSIIHATIIRQDEPSDDQSSVYHIFERLNTGVTLLHPQEIRACIFHGPFNDLLAELNEDKIWRKVYGPPSNRLKDQELILRFFALYFWADRYERPMKNFLSEFMGSNRFLKPIHPDDMRKVFNDTVKLINQVFSSRAFRLERALNAAVYDSVMVGLAHRLERGMIKKTASLEGAYKSLLGDNEYLSSVRTSTSNESNVANRLKKAVALFSRVS